MSTDERTLAVEHIKKLQKMASFGKELIIFDRGYALGARWPADFVCR
jgi:hypothetical protein